MTDQPQVLGRIKSALEGASAVLHPDGEIYAQISEALRLLDGLGEVDEGAVERVARAIWDSEWPGWPQGYADRVSTYHRLARAAIAALASPALKDAGK